MRASGDSGELVKVMVGTRKARDYSAGIRARTEFHHYRDSRKGGMLEMYGDSRSEVKTFKRSHLSLNLAAT